MTEQASAMYQLTKVGRILLFIPILFVVLRMWAVVQYFYTIYLVNVAQNNSRCIPANPHETVHIVLAVLQVSGHKGGTFYMVMITLVHLGMLYSNMVSVGN